MYVMKGIETDPNVEVFHWLEVMKLREIYEKPFDVSRKLEKEPERSDMSSRGVTSSSC